MTQTISYSVSIQEYSPNSYVHIPSTKILILDISTLSDLSFLDPIDLSQYSAIIHLSTTMVLNPEYTSKFPTNIPNICFLFNGVFSNAKSQDRIQNDQKYLIAHKLPIIQYTVSRPSSLQIPGFYSVTNKDSFTYQNDHFELTNLSLFKKSIQESKCEIPTVKSFGVTVLGVGCGFLTAEVSLSSYIIHTPTGFVILDCGESCLEQIMRKYGKESTIKILENLECIWISHSHDDHTSGLLNLLQFRIDNVPNATEKNLIIAADPGIISLIMTSEKYTFQKYNYHSDNTLNIHTNNPFFIKAIPESDLSLLNSNNNDNSNNSKKLKIPTDDAFNVIQNIPLKEDFPPGSKYHITLCDRTKPVHFSSGFIEGFPVDHIEYSMGCKMTIHGKDQLNQPKDYILAYSGDQYSDGSFTRAVGPCDLLIHEATFIGMEDKCLTYKHTSLETAIKVVHEMPARYGLFTHFSYRNSLEMYIRNCNEPNIFFASDFMYFSIDDLDNAYSNKKDP